MPPQTNKTKTVSIELGSFAYDYQRHFTRFLQHIQYDTKWFKPSDPKQFDFGSIGGHVYTRCSPRDVSIGKRIWKLWKTAIAKFEKQQCEVAKHGFVGKRRVITCSYCDYKKTCACRILIPQGYPEYTCKLAKGKLPY